MLVFVELGIECCDAVREPNDLRASGCEGDFFTDAPCGGPADLVAGELTACVGTEIEGARMRDDGYVGWFLPDSFVWFRPLRAGASLGGNHLGAILL